MYSQIDAVGIAVETATAPGGGIARDRARFAPFFAEAERFARERNMIVGGHTATLLLLDEPLGPSDFVFAFYSRRALDDARGLADALYRVDPDGLGHYVKMRTETPQKVHAVEVDERPLFRVVALETVRSACTADAVMPVPRPAYFARDDSGAPLNLACMGADVQLVGVYSALSDPARAGEWLSALDAEDRLRPLFIAEAPAKIERAVSGGDSASAPAAEFAAALVAEFAPRVGHVVVGDYAVAALDGTPPGARARLQLVCEEPFDAEEKALVRIAERFGLRVQTAITDPHIPTAPKLRRMTVYVVRPSERREAVLDLYDAGAYELVPYVSASQLAAGVVGGRGGVVAGRGGGRRRKDRSRSRSPRRSKPPPRDKSPAPAARRARAAALLPPDARVGSPFVVMRFLLVEAWNFRMMMRMEMLDAARGGDMLRSALENFKTVERAYLRLRRGGDFALIFPDSCSGVFVDAARQEKRQRFAPSAPRVFFPPYFPALAAKKPADAAGRRGYPAVAEEDDY
jgi:hypothetical protein